MCVAINKPAGIKLDKEIYEESWRMHGDGVGIAYVDEEKGSLVIEKGFMKKDDAIEAILKHEDKHLLIHFRKVSRGPVNPENCHPFEAFSNPYEEEGFSDENPRYQFAIAHNGTFNIKVLDNLSDTATLMKQVIGPWLLRDPELFDHHYARFIWAGYCDKGSGMKNRIAVMKYDRKEKKTTVEIVGREEGVVYQGCWFSNTTWIPMGPKWAHARGTNNGNHYPNGPQNQTHYHGHTTHGNGGGYSLGLKGDYEKPNKFVGLPIPHSEDVGWGEMFSDHLGWRWHNVDKAFYNTRTGCKVDELTYRNHHDDDYVYQGQKMKRTELKSTVTDISTEKKTSTTESSPDSSVSSTASTTNPVADANSQISVPRDKDVEMVESHKRFLELQLAIKGGAVNHLDKKERKALIRIAKDYVDEAYGREMRQDANHSIWVGLLRNDILAAYPNMKHWSLLQMDRHIIEHHIGLIDILAAAKEEEKRDALFRAQSQLQMEEL